MPELTKDERAYRRGCSQTMVFVLSDLLDQPEIGMVPHQILTRLARWGEELAKVRGNTDPWLLGTYLDCVKNCVENPEVREVSNGQEQGRGCTEEGQGEQSEQED